MFLLNLSKNNFLFCIENYNIKLRFNKSIKQYGRIFNIFRIIVFVYYNPRSNEAGSKECRHLIEAKESLLSTLDALSNINSTDLIQIQIKEIYKKLEQMHDNRKKIESATNYL